jgi:hypothetical protein
VQVAGPDDSTEERRRNTDVNSDELPIARIWYDSAGGQKCLVIPETASQRDVSKPKFIPSVQCQWYVMSVYCDRRWRIFPEASGSIA